MKSRQREALAVPDVAAEPLWLNLITPLAIDLLGANLLECAGAPAV
jgi:hypothetical protein